MSKSRIKDHFFKEWGSLNLIGATIKEDNDLQHNINRISSYHPYCKYKNNNNILIKPFYYLEAMKVEYVLVLPSSNHC
jgi:hypothetical protein